MDRNTMIKRFEETTKQEIINHNRAMGVTNSSIVELKQKLENILVDQKKHFASFGTLYLSQERKIKTLSDENILNIQKVDSKVNDLNGFYKVLTAEITRIATNSFELSESTKKLSERILQNYKDIRSLNESLCKIVNDFEAKLTRLEHVVSDRHSKLIADIAITPKKLDLLNESISYKIEEQQVNYSCLRDELEIAKRDVKHLQKYIESIHTQIARISKTVGD